MSIQTNKLITRAEMTAPEQKTETLNLRVSPQFKASLQAAAKRERRSMANMVEFLVIEYCRQHGLAEPELRPEPYSEKQA
jgi:hypothetical protein